MRCGAQLYRLLQPRGRQAGQKKRNTLVWEIEKRLAEDGAQPVIFFPRGGTFRQPWVKGLALILEEWRTEWLAARF